MRILHVIPSYAPAWRYGGPIRWVFDLCRHLARLGHDTWVYTTDADGPERLHVPTDAASLQDGVHVRYFRRVFPSRLYRAADMEKTLAATIATFDVVHLHSLFLWPTWRAARAAERAGVPYVVSPRGMLVPDLIRSRSRLKKMLWIHAVERRTLERARAIHVTSEAESRELATFDFRWPPVARIENGIEVAAFAEAAPRREVGDRVLYLGRVQWKKRLDRVLYALPLVRGVRLTIAGVEEDGHLRPLLELANSLGVADRVEVVGPVYGEEKVRLIARHDAVVLPSQQENFGNVVLEAMACGRPVLVTSRVGAAEVVRAHRCGLVVDGAPEGLAVAMALMLGEEGAVMGRRGRAAAACYDAGAIAVRHVELYQRMRDRTVGPVLASRKPSAPFVR